MKCGRDHDDAKKKKKSGEGGWKKRGINYYILIENIIYIIRKQFWTKLCNNLYGVVNVSLSLQICTVATCSVSQMTRGI